MTSPPDRKDRHAARLAVDVGFCTSRDVDAALRQVHRDGAPQPKVSLAYQLLRSNKITAAQYRLLNTGVRHEIEREDDAEFARFLVANHLIKQAQADDLIDQQTPYYREGKGFTRLDALPIAERRKANSGSSGFRVGDRQAVLGQGNGL